MKKMAISSLVAGCLVSITAGAALAASTPWRNADECARLKVGSCNSIITVASSNRASANDGSCRGHVGIQVKHRKNGVISVSSAQFAHQEIGITAGAGQRILDYKVWHA